MSESATEPEALIDVVAPRAPIQNLPVDGVPDPLTTNVELTRLTELMRGGTGPVAVDTERASGYRYSQRAYLIQLRRAGVGTALIDPIELPNLENLNRSIGAAEWVLHAANQDLPCLAEVGLRPARIFDTELAGRLLGNERVALGTMVEKRLGIRLEKGHSAADWSTRPIPYEWLIYAALDVELLVQLREVMAELLEQAGKLDWATEEFEAIRLAPPPPERAEPWRRTSGLHKIHKRRQLAVVRALWNARDEYAASRDIAPGRILPDAAIIDAARSMPGRRASLAALPVFGGPRQRRQLDRWFNAIESALALDDGELPAKSLGDPDGVPASSRWREKDPIAADRLARCRAAIRAVAEENSVLPQNLLASSVIRRFAWHQPEADVDAVAERLTELGARRWQRQLTSTALAAVLAESAG